MILIWCFLEFGRPPNPLKLPLIISLVSLAGWLWRREKRWQPQGWGFVVFLGVMALSGLTAANGFSAFSTTKDMAIRMLCICVPLISLVTSVTRMRWVVFSLLAAGAYVGVWAALHNGYGPSGGAGGQDENYVAALMGMAMPFAYFSLFVEKPMVIKLGLMGLLGVFVAAIALGGNPSRGGFLGLVAVTLYCLARSPRKVAGFTVVGIAAVVMVLVAGPKFWNEIRTTTDVGEGTADMRIEIWKMGIRMWQAHPVIGVGGGNFRWVIGDYQSAEQTAKFGRNLGGSIIAHSLPIELLAELGLAGVLVLSWLVWRTWKNLGRTRNQALDVAKATPANLEAKRLVCYSDAVRASMLAVLVNGVFLSLLHYSHIWVLIALGSALPLLISSTPMNTVPPNPAIPARDPRGVQQRPASRPRTPRAAPVVMPTEAAPGPILE